MEGVKSRISCLVPDRRMLPIKLHFFFYSVAISTVTAFLPLLCRNKGLSEAAIGIIFSISTMFSVITNPVFGWIADRLQKLTLVIITMVIIQIPFLAGNVFVPPINNETRPISAKLRCSLNNSYVIYPSHSNVLTENTTLKCVLDCAPCIDSEPRHIQSLCGSNIEAEAQTNILGSPDFLKMTSISRGRKLILTKCDKNETLTNCQAYCSGEAALKPESEFASYQFWLFFFLIVSSNALTNAIMGTGDAACYEALEGRVNQFGKQKVWFTIGWGAGTSATGCLLHLTRNSGKVDYHYTVYFLLILVVIDVIALSRTKLKKPESSKHILKDVWKVFRKLHPIFFTIAAVLIGFSAALQRTYQFLYLKELGGSFLLLGLSDGILCILIEAPFIFISGWIVKRTGRDNCVVFALLSYTVWFIAASIISNPWWILLINVTEAPSLGLFTVAMSSYGKMAAIPGTEATMQTFLGAMLWGLGMSSGSLVGGIGYKTFGGSNTFRYTGFLTLGLAAVYKFLTFFVAGEHTITQESKENTEVKATQKSDNALSLPDTNKDGQGIAEVCDLYITEK